MPNFTVKEMTYSSTAVERDISNIPNDAQMANIMFTISQLEKVRMLLGNNRMNISSGYRSPALNIVVGGSKYSAHLYGLAADFTCAQYGTPEAIVAALRLSDIPYDQLILEYPNRASSWVHIGFTVDGIRPRKQCLVTVDGTYQDYKDWAASR